MHIYICVNLCTYIHIHIYVYNAYMCKYPYIYIYVYICIHIYVYMYTHTFRQEYIHHFRATVKNMHGRALSREATAFDMGVLLWLYIGSMSLWLARSLDCSSCD